MTRAERVISFIETYLRIPEGTHVGKPIKLVDFQKKLIKDIYDNPHGTTTAYLSVGRKNGKSALIAGILLAHLVGPEAVQNSQIVSGAMSRDQAALVFNLAVKMVNLNPDLSDLVHVIPSGKRLIGKLMNVEYKALAAEGKTAHGLSPVLAILDEVGQVSGPRSEFIDAIVTAQGAHEKPLLIAISTQSATDSDLFSIWLDDAEKSKDPHIVSHVYSAPKECKLTDIKAWKAGNPALGMFRSLQDVERLAERAERMPSSEATFRNLVLNQRVSTVSPFVSLNCWKSCGGEPAPLETLHDIRGGLDLSSRADLTAFVLSGKDSDGIIHVHPFFWVPEVGLYDRAKRDRAPYDVWVRQGFMRTAPGATVDYEFVVADMLDILSNASELVSLAFDRWRIDVMKKEIERAGVDLPLVPFGQGFKDMSPALESLEAHLLNARLRHGNHPVLSMCAANAVTTKDPSGNRKLDKHRATGRIDGMVALAMSVGNHAETDELEDLSEFLAEPIII